MCLIYCVGYSEMCLNNGLMIHELLFDLACDRFDQWGTNFAMNYPDGRYDKNV